MGKKVSPESVKISKNEKHQFNSLINILKPKVYITDSSSFKRLVQELTGNNSTTASPTPVPFSEKEVVEIVSVEEVEDQRENIETNSVEVSTDDSSKLCYNEFMNEGLNQVWHQMCVDDTTLEDSITNNPVDHLFTYQELESLLLDVEPYPFYNSCAYMGQEVSIYDYELAGLI
ncbi:VQ motif containing protein [Quillaja saponaria]|uniref:VQ motif containing protein n=1 Tax=Quillaja saponaria TaxID=32244 RepID=A0AAD7PS43_QUISA|nr:VQ motif containing protein [Quillaja saponaria]